MPMSKWCIPCVPKPLGICNKYLILIFFSDNSMCTDELKHILTHPRGTNSTACTTHITPIDTILIIECYQYTVCVICGNFPFWLMKLWSHFEFHVSIHASLMHWWIILYVCIKAFGLILEVEMFTIKVLVLEGRCFILPCLPFSHLQFHEIIRERERERSLSIYVCIYVSTLSVPKPKVRIQ